MNVTKEKLIDFPIRPTLQRAGSPRAVTSVRARVAHTSAQKRRLDLFITEPALRRLGWREGGAVECSFAPVDGRRALALIAPAHVGLRLHRTSPRSGTMRVAVSGAPLARGLCARVRDVPFHVEPRGLVVHLPIDWLDAEVAAPSGPRRST